MAKSREGLWTELWEEAEASGSGTVLDRMKLGILSRGKRWEDLVADGKQLGWHRLCFERGVGWADAQWTAHLRRELAYGDSSEESESDGEGLDFEDRGGFEEHLPERQTRAAMEEEELEGVFKDVPRTFAGLPEAKTEARRAADAVARILWGRDEMSGYLFGGPVKKNRKKRERTLARVLVVGARRFGYCQGMNFVAALLESETSSRSAADVYALYGYLLRELKVDRLYGRSLAAYLSAFEICLKRDAPLLEAHLRTVGFVPQLYAVEWFSAMFSVSVPRLLCFCVFDLVFAQFRDAPIRVALGLLKANQSKLLKLATFEHMADGFKSVVRGTDPKTALTFAVAVQPANPACDVLHAVAPRAPESRFQSRWQRNGLPTNGPAVPVSRPPRKPTFTDRPRPPSVFIPDQSEPSLRDAPPPAGDTPRNDADVSSSVGRSEPPSLRAEANPHQPDDLRWRSSSSQSQSQSGGGSSSPGESDSAPQSSASLAAASRSFATTLDWLFADLASS